MALPLPERIDKLIYNADRLACICSSCLLFHAYAFTPIILAFPCRFPCLAIGVRVGRQKLSRLATILIASYPSPLAFSSLLGLKVRVASLYPLGLI